MRDNGPTLIATLLSASLAACGGDRPLESPAAPPVIPAELLHTLRTVTEAPTTADPDQPLDGSPLPPPGTDATGAAIDPSTGTPTGDPTATEPGVPPATPTSPLSTPPQPTPTDAASQPAAGAEENTP